MIRFTLDETPEQEVIYALKECAKIDVFRTIANGVEFFKKTRPYIKDYEIYKMVGLYCKRSDKMVQKIYLEYKHKTNK